MYNKTAFSFYSRAVFSTFIYSNYGPLTRKRFLRKVLKITLVILGLVAVLMVAFHFWFISHARSMLEDTVRDKSGGRIKLKIRKLHYNYFTRKMVLDDAVFYTTDTLTAPSAYRFAIPELRLRLNGLFPLLFEKKLLIDSLHLQSPLIEVTTLRYAKDTVQKKKENISIPYEMGKVYKSIQDALKVLQVKQFQLEDGRFTLINKVAADQLPLVISKIDFQIDNLRVDADPSVPDKKILFSDNIILRSENQNILFPDRRHRLSFSRFRINLQKRLVEFDSCTIEAPRKDSTGSSFKVFFNALLLTNIDFDTLYKTEVIKADSVYCVNPRFSLDVELGRKSTARRNPPKLEKIIEQLTGDLQLGYVVVENADFDIRTTRDGVPSSFTFTRNNFEMQGLSVIQDDPRPIRVKSFDMAIRNYENFIKDSSYSVKFDSVIFRNDRITLSNFLFNKLNNGRIINTFSVPRFSLEGLSWDYLVFEKKLKARQALMEQPHISYTASGKRSRRQSEENIFQSLGAVNDYMDLEKLDISNGNIDLRLKDNLQIQLDNATLSVQSHSLLTSTRISGIKNSLTSLKFDRGRIQAGNLQISLDGIRYTGDEGRFGAARVRVGRTGSPEQALLNQVSVEKLYVDEVRGDIIAKGIRWQQAAIRMDIAGNGKRNGSLIDLEDIRGGQTDINSFVKGKNIKVHLDGLSAGHFLSAPGRRPELSGFKADGSRMDVTDPQMQLSAASFRLHDLQSSELRNVQFTMEKAPTHASVVVPLVNLVPDIQSWMDGKILSDELILHSPDISFRTQKNNGSASAAGRMPETAIRHIRLDNPQIDFSKQTDSGMVHLSWKRAGSGDHILDATGLQISPSAYALGAIQFNLSHFTFTNAQGKTFSTGNGHVRASLKDLSLLEHPDDDPEWGLVAEQVDARDFIFDSLNKNGGRLTIQSARLQQLHLNSSALLKMQQLAAENPSLRLSEVTGKFETPAIALHWYNAAFDRAGNMFSLDSFSYSPAISIDSFLAVQTYQKDYTRAGSGRLQMGPVDINRFIDDSALIVHKVKADRAYLFDYKDRNLPFNSGVIKPLPVNLLKLIPVKFRVDSMVFTNASVDYTEVSEKTKIAGNVPVMRMQVALAHVKNFGAVPGDSLRIKATGYLLDTVWIRLHVNESYTDSLGGFLTTVRLKPGDLTVLNKPLIALGSVKLLAGELDTLEMRAVGREYLSLGEMKMYYRNLKIQVLKNGKEGKQGFFTRFRSFLANTFIIRSNNHSRTGNVFFIRQRDRSAINYLIKITFSGMASSVGAKNNRKMIRRYKDELEKRHLPPINLD